MKKYVLLIEAALLLPLTSCEVHFGSSRAIVPWYFIAVPAAVFALICFAIALVSISRQTYKCPGCGEEFHPKWYQFSALLHNGDDRLLKCPGCRRRSFCRKK